MEKKTDQNKKQLLTGFILIVTAFVCATGVFYVMVNTQMANSEEISALKMQLGLLGAEKAEIERLTLILEKKVGSSIDVEKIVKEADKIYADTEKRRREGHLWIDRKAETCIATLGALHGLTQGSRLTIYDGNDEIGFLRVEIPLDVISYVQPINKPFDQFKNDYYRVVFEE